VTGGNTLVKVNSLVGTAVLAVGKPCNVVAIRGITTTAAVAFIQLFDKATAAEVTPGTTLPDWVVEVPAGTPVGNTSVGDGVPSVAGLRFENGVVVIATTTSITGTAAVATHVRLAIY
jgi:hypothetical protein